MTTKQELQAELDLLEQQESNINDRRAEVYEQLEALEVEDEDDVLVLQEAGNGRIEVAIAEPHTGRNTLGVKAVTLYNAKTGHSVSIAKSKDVVELALSCL